MDRRDGIYQNALFFLSLFTCAAPGTPATFTKNPIDRAFVSAG